MRLTEFNETVPRKAIWAMMVQTYREKRGSLVGRHWLRTEPPQAECCDAEFRLRTGQELCRNTGIDLCGQTAMLETGLR